MATGQVGQYQLGSFASPINGGPLDANVVRGNDNSIVGAYDNHDNDPTIHVQNFPFASLPSASTLGRFLIANDTYRAYFDTGSVLQEIAYLSKSGGAITGNLTVSGTFAAAGATTLGASVQITGTAGTPSTGSGLEFTGGATPRILAFNRLGPAYLPLNVDGSTVSLRTGPANILAVQATTTAVTMALPLTVTGALLPGATATYDLGATGTRWNSLFLAAGIAMGGSISGATTGSFSGAVSASGFSGILDVATGTQAAGRIYKTAANGLVLQGVTGSSNDFLLTGPSNTQIAVVPTGTNTVNFAGNLRGAKIAGLTGTPTVGSLATGVATATLGSGASDVHGVLTITTDNVGGSIAAGQTLATVTYSAGYTFAPAVTIQGQGANVSSLGAQFYQITSPSASFFSIVSTVAIPRTNTTVYVNYQVLGS